MSDVEHLALVNDHDILLEVEVEVAEHLSDFDNCLARVVDHAVQTDKHFANKVLICKVAFHDVVKEEVQLVVVLLEDFKRELILQIDAESFEVGRLAERVGHAEAVALVDVACCAVVNVVTKLRVRSKFVNREHEHVDFMDTLVGDLLDGWRRLDLSDVAGND